MNSERITILLREKELLEKNRKSAQNKSSSDTDKKEIKQESVPKETKEGTDDVIIL